MLPVQMNSKRWGSGVVVGIGLLLTERAPLGNDGRALAQVGPRDYMRRLKP